ncbi:MAG: hypothetical protein JSV64_01870, partial [Candidatus Bathyarchaeota archaeon]
MKRLYVIGGLVALLLFETSVFSALLSQTIIRSSGYIRIGSPEVGSLNIWIADFMADLLSPNFDYSADASRWQDALNDLRDAQLTPPPNSEITHVQMRIWWDLNLGSGSTVEDWVNPYLGSSDAGQVPIMNNQQWQRWYFNRDNDLQFGPSAAERIHNAGFKMEFTLSGAWNRDISDPSKPPPFFRGRREADYPEWIALGGGETFLRNYYANVLRPVAEFVASSPNFIDGDIFGVSFEMNYPEADFTWLHNDTWKRMISGGVNATPYLDDDPSKPGVRKIFQDAGKSGVLITIHHQGWYDDFGLGYSAVKSINPNAPIPQTNQGISGATYLSAFDFIAISEWVTVVRQVDAPPDGTPWDETGRYLFRDGWYNDLTYAKTGTPSQQGRNLIEDFATLSEVLNGTKILMNSGYEARHYAGVTWPPSGSLDHTAQREAWAGHVLALSNQSWCAGQDFERYTEDKTARPTDSRTSWRNALAQEVIISIISAIRG